MKSSENSVEIKEGTESIPYRVGPLFAITLLLISIAGVAFAGFLLWYVPTVGLRSIHPVLPYAVGTVVFGVGLFVLAGVSVMAVSLIRGKDALPSPRFRWVLVKVFLPVMVLMGGVLKIKKIKIEQAFLDLNNRMVRAMVKRGHVFSPGKIVILMPHCIQYEDCRIKVTKDVKNCVGCGRCEIGELVALSERFGLNLFVLTGGTVARRKLFEYRPDAVIAVACERDLTSGVQDAYPLPVVTIVNKRPFGYCAQTGVEIDDIKEAIEGLLGEAA